jgi:hypothetical protein
MSLVEIIPARDPGPVYTGLDVFTTQSFSAAQPVSRHRVTLPVGSHTVTHIQA